MDYCIQFIDKVEIKRSVNYVRLYKGIYLLVELVRENSKKMSDCFIKREECSAIMWCHKTKIEILPTKK